MNYLKQLAVIMLAVIFMTACNQDSYQTTDTGLQYKFYNNDEGETPQLGDFLMMEMVYGLEDTVLWDSRNVPNDFNIPLEASLYDGDLFEAFSMLSPGDSASFLISADSFYLLLARAPSLPDFVEPGDFLTFDIKLLGVQNAEEKAMAEAAALEELRIQAEADLTAYLAANSVTTEALPSGLIFIEEKAGRGAKPKAEEMVKVHLTISLVDGTEMYSTKDAEPFEYQYGNDFDTKGLEEGVGMLRVGGKARLIVPQQLAYGAEGRGQMMPPYSSIIYDVELVDIRSKAEYDKEMAEKQAQQQAQEDVKKNAEKADRDNYLSANNITVEPTATGLYYIETEKGSGEKAMPGNTVTVHYTGKLLNGTVFDSSVEKGEPFSFRLGVGQVIKGWDEAIGMMNKGGKATLVIPSIIAYGSADRGTIPPYSTLVFDVELIDVQPAPAQ